MNTEMKRSKHFSQLFLDLAILKAAGSHKVTLVRSARRVRDS
jgi:hypothetical protein